MAAVLGGYDFIASLSVFLSAFRGLCVSILSNQAPNGEPKRGMLRTEQRPGTLSIGTRAGRLG